LSSIELLVKQLNVSVGIDLDGNVVILPGRVTGLGMVCVEPTARTVRWTVVEVDSSYVSW
jgi:hypothetical protein